MIKDWRQIEGGELMLLLYLVTKCSSDGGSCSGCWKTRQTNKFLLSITHDDDDNECGISLKHLEFPRKLRILGTKFPKKFQHKQVHKGTTVVFDLKSSRKKSGHRKIPRALRLTMSSEE